MPGKKACKGIAAAAGAGLLAVLLAAFVVAFSARLTTPQPTVLLLDRSGRFLGEIGTGPAGTIGYWPVEDLPPRVVAATLAVEDRRFATHPGVDPFAVARAAWQNIRARRRVSGASTIAMQVARLQSPGRRSWGRKLTEALTAVGLTARYGREAILSHYLRLVPYGNRIRGIAYAARRYLDKPVEDLSWAETAFLCSLPQAPGRMNPYDPRGRSLAAARAERILWLLGEEGKLTSTEMESAVRELALLRIPTLPSRSPDALHPILALEEKIDDPQVGRALPSPPLVRTSLELGLQEELSRRISSALQEWEGRGPENAALIVVERRTGEIRAWVGSGGYFDESAAGAIDYTGVPRLAGSTLKPFFYALALERGKLTPASILHDRRRGPAGIENSDRRSLGPMLPRFALANSRNVPAAQLLAEIGLSEGYDLLGKLGLHDHEHPAKHYGLGLSVGSLPVTLEGLVRAYTALAGDGVLQPLSWYEGEPSGETRQVLEEESSRQVALFLSDPLARLPTFPRMGPSEFSFPAAVKTGTSADFRDAWCVAWSNRYLVGAWVGRPDYRPMRRMGGYASAAVVVSDTLALLHEGQGDGLDDIPFPPPRGSRPVRLCVLSGKRAGVACERVAGEWFREGEEPDEECDAHRFEAYDRRSGELAERGTPSEFVEVRTIVSSGAWYGDYTPRQSLRRGYPIPGDKLSPRSFPGVMAGEEPIIRILSPPENVRYFADPEAPRNMSSIALEAEVFPPTSQILWEIDGKPYALVDYPSQARWPLTPGRHTFRARIPLTPYVSKRVKAKVF